MVALTTESPLYKELFVGLPKSFDSQFPPYKVLLDSVTDTSVGSITQSQERLNGAQTVDLQGGSQLAMRSLALAVGDTKPINFPSALLPGLAAVLKSNPVPTQLTDSDVLTRIMAAKTPADVAGVVLGAALAALTVAVPLIGIVASAIVGVAAAIFKAADNAEKKQQASEAARREALYKTFPPLQEYGGAESDQEQVRVMLDLIRGGDWTALYLPRFMSNGKVLSWKGIERVGGFAFAPGDADGDASNFAGDVNEKFVASGGYGVIPGTDIVTSVIQVSLAHDPSDPYSGPFQQFMKGKAQDPRALAGAYTRVSDCGTYYPSTGRMGAMFWDLANNTGNWYKYRIDTRQLLDAWEQYCRGAIEFITGKCYTWAQKFTTGSGPVGPTYDLNADYEGFFGTGIFFGVGVFTGRVTGGTNFHPEYSFQPPPGGRWRGEIVQPDLYKRGDAINSEFSGAFLPVRSPEDVPKAGLGTIFDRGPDIQGKLQALRKRQSWELHHTLVSAYCSASDAAFKGDPKLAAELQQVRNQLLDSEDRFWIDLDDVPDNEPGLKNRLYWESWKKQLLAAGVTGTAPKGSKGGGLKMAPPKEPEPPAPPVTPGFGFPMMPGGGTGDASGDGGGGGGALVAGGLFTLLLAAAAARFKGKQRVVAPTRIAMAPRSLAGGRLR